MLLPAWYLVLLVSFINGEVPVHQTPPSDSMNVSKIELGRHFFYDKRLSKSGTKSCSSCHEQRFAFSDGYRTSLGADGEPLLRNALPLFNLSYLKSYTWANECIRDLPTQMLGPLFNKHPVEMGFIEDDNTLSEVLLQDSFYQGKLLDAFPELKQQYTEKEVIDCITEFMLQLQSFDSDYDQFLKGNRNLTARQADGMALFYSERLGCSKCHGRINFSDPEDPDEVFFNTGIIYRSFPAHAADSGLYIVTRKKGDIGKFRVPSLRNLAYTAPYMHDGSMQTLNEVLEHYDQVVSEKQHLPLSKDLQTFTLRDEDKKSLIAFLLSLSDSSFINNPEYSNPFLP